MTTEKLFDEGKYMVIYIYPETVKLDERQFFLWNLEDMSTAKANTHCIVSQGVGEIVTLCMRIWIPDPLVRSSD
jgi:hypothetical protein